MLTKVDYFSRFVFVNCSQCALCTAAARVSSRGSAGRRLRQPGLPRDITGFSLGGTRRGPWANAFFGPGFTNSSCLLRPRTAAMRFWNLPTMFLSFLVSPAHTSGKSPVVVPLWLLKDAPVRLLPHFPVPHPPSSLKKKFSWSPVLITIRQYRCACISFSYLLKL